MCTQNKVKVQMPFYFILCLQKSFLLKSQKNDTYSVIHFAKVKKLIVSLKSLPTKGESLTQSNGMKSYSKKPRVRLPKTKQCRITVRFRQIDKSQV